MPLAEAISYTLQIAEALAHADARSVVHRDIKPSNVLITPEGRVKLIDMGLARLRQADPAVADLTASGVTLGTFDYISPEQARDPRNADIRSDIYSLGCTFFFMLAGQPPFPEGTVLQKLLQHQGDEPPDILQFRPELPEESSRVLRKMMAKDPARRYASPADLVADLLELAEEIGLRPMSPTSRIWLVPAGGAAFVCPASLAVAGSRGRVGLHCRAAAFHLVTPRKTISCRCRRRTWRVSRRRSRGPPPSAEKAAEPAKPPGMPAEAISVGKGSRRRTGGCRAGHDASYGAGRQPAAARRAAAPRLRRPANGVGRWRDAARRGPSPSPKSANDAAASGKSVPEAVRIADRHREA